MATKKSTSSTPRKTAAKKKTTETPETPQTTSTGGAAVVAARETSTPAATTTASKSANAGTPNFQHPADIQDRIRRRAFDLFQQRGGHHGFDVEDWFKAEAEIKKGR
jgi:Protein of unknown function (DUF2934)